MAGIFGLSSFMGDMSPDMMDPEKVKAMARAARLKGMGDGGPVNQIKVTSDQSGATGINDYFSALGYDA